MYKNNTVTAIIVAAGTSSRMGFDKLSYVYNGKTIFEHSLNAFDTHDYIDEIIVVAGNNIDFINEKICNCKKKYHVVNGGKTRSESVKNGVLKAKSKIIAIHDAARPFVSYEIIKNTIEKALEIGAAAPAVPVKDTIKIVDETLFVKSTPNRQMLYAVQTPQCFKTKEYIDILQNYYNENVTDDCSLYENANRAVFLTQGCYSNLKITTKDDLPMNINSEEGDKMDIRIGHGYDVHKLVSGRLLILGGVIIEHETGLLGHSDADVLAHAIADALLGAACMGDIGKIFPDTDKQFKNANSIELLKIVTEKIKEKNYSIGNVDSTIVCQSPKLASYIEKMRENLAQAMEIEPMNVSVKATTEEGLGFTGEKLAIAAHAVCILKSKND